MLRGVAGSRGRKRASKARRFVTGNKGFLTTSTVLTAAGLAWGVYDSLKSGGGAVADDSSAAGASSATGAPGAVGAPVLPPPLPLEMLRVVRLAVSAARADGTLSPEERAMIVQHAREAGIEQAVETELNTPQPIAGIVTGVTDVQRRKDLYVLAFAIVRADESVSGAERIYLAQLAHQLGLDPATVATLEQQTATNIDSADGDV